MVGFAETNIKLDTLRNSVRGLPLSIGLLWFTMIFEMFALSANRRRMID
jgi:hypothetical protein